MGHAVFIDACTLGKMSRPEANDCLAWAESLKASGDLIVIPAVADYEIRRELLRANKPDGIASLDDLAQKFCLLPISQNAMILAAKFWADLRTGMGKKGCDDKKIDADVILAAQARRYSEENKVTVLIATDNIRHFQALVDGTHIVGAKPWGEIAPSGPAPPTSQNPGSDESAGS